MTLVFQSDQRPLFSVLYALFQLGAQVQSQTGKSVDQALCEASTVSALKAVSTPSSNPTDLTTCQDRSRFVRDDVSAFELTDEQGALVLLYLERALPHVLPTFIERAAEVYAFVKAAT